MKTTTKTFRATLLFLFSSYTTTVSSALASAESEPSSLEDTLHNELSLDFAFNLPRQVSRGQELQPFFTTNFLGGQSPQPIVFSGNSERPFEVNGDTFPDFPTAANRVCDNQKNACADMANDASKQTRFRVGDCDEQRERCMNSAQSATETSFADKPGPTLVVSNATHDIFCDT